MTIAQSIQKKIPQTSIVYFGDTAWFPYNDKSAEEVIARAIYACEIFLSQNCSTVILACNTATVLAYDSLVEKFSDRIKIYNIVDLTIKSLLDAECIKSDIGIIGTIHTVNSNIYERNIEILAPHLSVKQLATPKLAALAEEYYTNRDVDINLLYEYLDSTNLKDIDTLLLACTHYSVFREKIEDFYRGKVNVIDSVHTTNTVFEKKFADVSIQDFVKKTPLVLCSRLTDNFSNSSKLFLGNDIILKEI